MDSRPVTSEYQVSVFQHPRSPFGYRWEIRRFRIGMSVERATRSYPTEATAGRAGQAALAALLSIGCVG